MEQAARLDALPRNAGRPRRASRTRISLRSIRATWLGTAETATASIPIPDIDDDLAGT
jgi:hypothetical protein